VKIKSAEFEKSAIHPKDYPEADLPEIAFGGRSNVGKSSLINSMVQRKKLVKVSGKPGHTQSINFFVINEELRFVDLPGYGYAKVSKEERAAWGPMIESYFEFREPLKGVVCIVDLRRGIEDDDLMLIEAAPHFGWQPIIVFTKADKFSRNQRFNRRREVAKKWGMREDDLILYSSKTGLGRDELWTRIVELTGLSR
jgi:GTP-binding protein